MYILETSTSPTSAEVFDSTFQVVSMESLLSVFGLSLSFYFWQKNALSVAIEMMMVIIYWLLAMSQAI